MSRIRSKDTKPELTLRRRLFADGLRFRTRMKLQGKPDIVFTRARFVVFVDGCFWHGCPQHGTMPKSNSEYWEAKLKRNKARDAEVSASLEAGGWKVLRYWDHEIVDDFDRVSGEIEAVWTERRQF